MDDEEEGRSSRAFKERKRYSSNAVVRHGPARTFRIRSTEQGTAVQLGQGGPQIRDLPPQNSRRHRLEFTFNQLTENALQRQLAEFHMVRSIGRPSILKTTALLELSESIDQSRRVTIDSSEMGADLMKAVALTEPSPEWQALPFPHMSPIRLCGIFSHVRTANEQDAVTFSFGPLAGTSCTFHQLWGQRKSEEILGGVLWYNLHMSDQYSLMKSGAMSAEQRRIFPGSLVQMMMEYMSGLYMFGFPGLDSVYKADQVSKLPPHVTELPKDVWSQLLAPLELSDFQVGRLMGLLYNQQTATKEFAMSISCMEDMLEDRVGSLQRDRGGYDPQDLHLQDAYAALKEARQKQRISQIKASSKVMFNILTPYQLALLTCELEYNVLRQPIQDWGDWMRLFHIMLHHCS